MNIPKALRPKSKAKKKKHSKAGSDSRSSSTKHAINVIIQHKNISMFCNHRQKG